ncbi:CS1 type fimbrial major subunit [Yersinia bercovieri]|uniref:CS1 type fimbrial major subunit n=1 Tax=Yersinia bercovieri TaxID=634 RepID=UPI0011A98B49|nr:CS1 type fimbrial major subunit [Yersinia bercovieri]
MMKKTLLSIMTMAILASSTVAYSNPVTKDIKVEATIPTLFSMSDNQGTAIEATPPLRMVHDADKGVYTITKVVKLNGNGGDLKVSMTKELELIELKSGRKFTHIELKLDSAELKFGVPMKFEKGKFNQDVNLVISGKEPVGAVGGETYSGTLKLTLEAHT